MWFDAIRHAFLRELRYLRGHPWDLALITWFPAVMLAITWAIFSPGVAQQVPIAVVDEDRSPASRRLVHAIEATRSCRVAARPASLEDAWTLVRGRSVYAVVHIPADWDRRARRGDRLPVVLYANEQFHAASGVIAPGMAEALEAVAEQEATGGLARSYRTSGVRVETRTLYVPQLSFERTLAGTFLPAMLHMFVLGGAGYAVGREFRDRTAGEWLASAQGNIAAALAGKLVPVAAASFVMALAIVAWFAGYRGWAVSGSVTVWCAGLLSLLVACCAIPALFVALTGTLRLALAAVAVLNVTAVAFAGLSYPFVSMTTTAKVWASALPFKYYFEIQQQQWHMGAPATDSLPALATLWIVFIAAPLALALPKLQALCETPETWGRR